MIDSGTYLWNCMKYIDLNMVRARVVENPSDWEWCGQLKLQVNAKDSFVRYPGDFITMSMSFIERIENHVY